MAQNVSVIPKRVNQRLKVVGARLRELQDPVVVCHIDADGLTSGAIMIHTLKTLGKKVEAHPVKQLDPNSYEGIPWDRDLVFTDLGSGQIKRTEGHVIVDHHQPLKEHKYQLNVHHLGMDGSRDMSASMLAYMLSRHVIGDNKMAGAAVVGMVGDQMTRQPLKGIARLPVETKWVKDRKGLKFFGRETRPLSVFLKYASEPFLPGLSGEVNKCYDFLAKLKLDPHRTYHSLNKEELKNFHTELIKYAAGHGVKVHRMLGEYYVLPHMPERTEMRDTSEFSTLLNACGRHERPDIGMGVLLGKNVYDEAQKLLRIHRMLLSRGMNELEDNGVTQFKNFQLFTSETIKPTILGIVAGIAISSRTVSPLKPIIAVTPMDGGYKVSGRATLELVEGGVNLGLAMRKAVGMAEEEEGGGHDVAAGAFVQEDGLQGFLLKMDKVLGRQMNK
ncbi:MAG TPA: DHH family phosphoesterase [archaeon]|nr:DHH family phosphoesterase [archaeon]